MSYPTKLKLFRAWAKAMQEGATVDKPDYGKTLTGSRQRRSPSKMKSHKGKKRRSRGKKTQD